jgi:hypothetical protein
VTVLAGVFSRISGTHVQESTRESVRRLVSRDSRDHVVEAGADDCFLAKVDIGVFGAPAGVEDSGGTVSMLAGEPLLLLDDSDGVRSRTQDLELIHRALCVGDSTLLARSTGAYCGAYFDNARRALSLYTDKLGLRPIYYYADPKWVFFASALRILESLVVVPKRFDVRGVAEISSFGFPLADRTAYEGISTLRAGEIVSVTEREIRKHEYWRWDRLPRAELKGPDLARVLHQRFVSGVRRRLEGKRTTAAFLSGGLDSRSIVSALRSLDTTVHTINWAPEKTQDEVFATMISQALGTLHTQLTKEIGSVSDRSQVYNQRAVIAWFDHVAATSEAPPARNLIWSGDGGSVGMGHVYLNDEIVALAQQGKERAAVEAFLRFNPTQLAAKLFRPPLADSIVAVPTRGILDELARIECEDRGRAFHLFLMLNDQRRHLADLYENIDLGRLELEMPFYDSAFLELVIASPVNAFLGHRFYMEWLKAFSKVVTSVPWQAYPGHVPCPLPAPEGLRYQWTDYYDIETAARVRAAFLAQADRLLRARRFPEAIIDKGRLRLLSWLARFGVRKYDYVIKQAAIFGKYWNICESAADS